MDETWLTGGCQCGAVRYRARNLGRASICHCRMCQKAFGGFFGPLVSAKEIIWTRGERSIFHSSNHNWRGFCNQCGTPLTYEYEGVTELAIGSFDNPEAAPPTVQVNTQYRCNFTDGLPNLPEVDPNQAQANDDWNAGIISNQHPDHDT